MLGGCGNGARQGDGDAVDGLVAHDADGGGPDAPGDDDGTDGGDDADHRPEVLVPPNCGDGVVDPGEECDDGNRLNGDECDWACRTGSGEPPPAEPLDEVADSDTLGLVVTGSDIWASGPSRESLAENDERSPLVWTGEHCATVALIADLDDTPDIASDLQFIKFDRAGRLVGPGWRLHEPGRPFGQADLVANEDGFGLVWTNWADSTVWFVELDLDGKPLYSPVALADGSPALAVSLVWHDGTYGVFWVEGAVPITDENRDAVRFLAFGSRGIRRGEPIDVFRTGEPNLVLEIDSATSGDRHAVAFLAGPPPTYRVEHGAYVFSAVVTAGAELLATPMRIGPSAPGQAVAVAWDRRSTFGLAWVRPDFDPAMHLARIDRDGVLFDAPRPVGKPWLMPPEPPEPLSLITPPYVSMAFGAGGWGIAFPQAPSNPTCRRYAGLVRTDRWGTLTDLVCLDGVLHTTQAYGDVVFDGEAFGWLHNSHFALRLVRWLVGP